MSTTAERFPTTIAYSSSGGPQYSTDVTVLNSGHEQRNQNWEQSRHRFRINYVRVGAELDSLSRLFNAVAGRACTFKFKNHLDFKSCDIDQTPAYTDQNIGAGDGTTLIYQVVKNYISNALTTPHDIKRLVAGTLLVGFQDNAATPLWQVQDTGNKRTVDEETGIITFSLVGRTVTGAVNLGGGVTRITSNTNHGMTATGSTAFFTTFTSPWDVMNDTRFNISNIHNATQFDVDFDSSSLAAYSGNAGAWDSSPQTGENVVVGYEYDLLCRFDSDEFQATHVDKNIVAVDLTIIEVRS